MSNVAEIEVLSEILKLIESTLKIPADKVDIDATLESFGINSLIVMELMEEIEKEFDITLTPAQFSNIDTVRGLAGLVETLVGKNADSGSGMQAAASVQMPSNVQPDASGQQAGNSNLLHGREVPAHQVLDYVRAKYAIDLSQQDFNSIEDIVDTLVANHDADLLRHYGLSGRSGYAAASVVPMMAIIGISCRLPDAPDHHVFWENLIEQKNSMREIPKTRWNWKDYYSETIAQGKTVSKWGALIDDVDCFDAGFFNIPAEEARTIDPQLRLLLEETYRAVEDAGINMKNLAGSRTGVFIGYEYSEYEHHLRKLNNQDFTKGPLFSSSSPSYYLANRISHAYDLCGPSEAYNANCASSAVAINRAYYSLLNGESDLAVAGAASLNLFAGDYIAASQYGVLSPNGTSGVFDDDANGFTRGEGVAVIVLKRLEDAEKDNNRIYGIIRSSHQNYRGAARNISEIKHESITNVIKECYEKAAVDLETIHYIEVDGYASKWADSFEYEGVKGVFQNSKVGAKHVALGSVKGNIGNVESVSGVTNVIKLALSLYHKKFPATISKKKVNTFMDIDSASHPLYIADKEIHFDSIRGEVGKPIRAGINSFADSGANVHILLEEYMAAKPATGEAAQFKQLFVLSAKDSKRLEIYVQRYLDFLSDETVSNSFTELIYTSQVGRESLNERLAIVASSRKELLDKLTLVKKTGIKDKLGLDSKDIYYGKINLAEKSSLASLITADMAHMQLMQSMQTAQWKQIAMLWVNGVAIPWKTMWQSKAVQRVSLPTYPFAKDRHWVDIDIQETPKNHVQNNAMSGLSEQESQEPEPGEKSVAAWYFYVPSDASRVQAAEVTMSRMEKLELFMKQEIAAQQKRPIDDIAIDKDFIELGMNSIGVAELIIKMDKLLQTNLSPSVLFKYPEIGMLSEYLAEIYAGVIDTLVVANVKPAPEYVKDVGESRWADERTAISPSDILIPMQAKGDKTPIFAIPGAGGNALSMQQLSHALGDKQPFYCLEPVGLNGYTPLMASIEEIAEFNIEALRQQQAAGPYRLLGYSNGGIVAFEMARKLLEQGEKVSSLVMLDTLSPSLLSKDQIEEMTVAVFNHFIGSLGAVSDLTVEQLKQVVESERSEYLYRYVVSHGIDLPKKQFMATFDVAIASELACRAYQPVKLMHKVDVSLFRATDGFKDLPADYGWGAFVSGFIQTREIRADHFSILEKDSVMDVAKQISHSAGRSARKVSKERSAVTA